MVFSLAGGEHLHSDREYSWATMVMARMDKPASLLDLASLFQGLVDKSSGKEIQCGVCRLGFEKWQNKEMKDRINRMSRLGDLM